MRGVIPEFGPRLRALREAKGLSMVRLAELADTVSDSIIKFEQGKRLPTLELAWRLASALGVSVNELLPSRRHPSIPPQGRGRSVPKAAG